MSVPILFFRKVKMKVKIFSSWSTTQIEEQMNEWMEDPKICVHSMIMSTAGTGMDRDLSIIVLVNYSHLSSPN